MSITALFYNWGFFTLLGYAPFPMRLGVHQLGYVFAGWGLLLEIFSVFVAPRLQRRFGTSRTLYVNLGLLAGVLLVIAIGTSSQLTMIVAVIASGSLLGINKHPGDHGGHDSRTGAAPGGLGRLRLRPIHRGRARPLRGRQACRALQRASAPF